MDRYLLRGDYSGYESRGFVKLFILYLFRLQCYCHAGNMPTTQDNQQVIPVEQIISHPPTIQQDSYAYNPFIHPAAVNSETLRAVSVSTTVLHVT